MRYEKECVLSVRLCAVERKEEPTRSENIGWTCLFVLSWERRIFTGGEPQTIPPSISREYDIALSACVSREFLVFLASVPLLMLIHVRKGAGHGQRSRRFRSIR
jgi:hypothetical protein